MPCFLNIVALRFQLSAAPPPQEDQEGQLAALHVLQDLLTKQPAAFDEQIARLGLPNKIASLAGPPEEEQTDGEGGWENKPTETPEKPEAEPEDAGEIALFSPYQWRDWSIVRSRDCLYLWNEFCALELSSVSNGWFRFLLDNKLATMYSSGSTEGGPDSFGGWSLLTLLWCRYKTGLG